MFAWAAILLLGLGVWGERATRLHCHESGMVCTRFRSTHTLTSFLPRIMSSVVKSASFLNVPRPKSRL